MEVFYIMKKKFFTVALATTMALSSVLTANAASLSGAWWTAWTEGYELTDTLEFDIEVKGGDAVWNNVAAVFVNAKTTGTQAPADEVGSSYKEYAVVRGDNWGWGGGDNKTVDGNDITYDGGVATLGDDDFIATMKDCHIDATITKSGNDVTMVYNITGTNGKTATRTAKFTSDMSEGVYVFFVPDTSEITVTQVTAGNDANANTNNDANKTSDNDANKTSDNDANKTSDNDANVNNDANKTSNGDASTTTTTPKTADVAPVAALAAVAVVACAGVVVSRKKVTE
jgi:hypothetical protein